MTDAGMPADVEVEDLGLRLSFVMGVKWEWGLGVVGLFGRELWEQPKFMADLKISC